MNKATVGILVAGGMAVIGGAAFAQGSPSADSIINSLTPRAGMQGTTRGIRPMNPTGAAPVSPATPAAVDSPAARVAPRANTRAPAPVSPTPRPATAEAAPSVNLTVQFATDSAELTPTAIHTLDELGRALSSQTLSTYHFRIEGHTDTVGSADHNMTLSEARAKSVVDYLVSKFHVDASRLEPVGMGESHPLVPTRDSVSEPRNRRVTVVNLGA